MREALGESFERFGECTGAGGGNIAAASESGFPITYAPS